MTSDPSGETVNKIHPGLVTGDEQHNNTVSTEASIITVTALDSSQDQPELSPVRYSDMF